MKYALIVMLAVYLVTFGCNPKTEEKNRASHDKPEQISVEAPAAVTPAPPTDVHISAGSKAAEIKPVPEITGVAAPVKIELPGSKGEEELNNQWKAIAQSAATTVLAVMNEETKEAEPTQPAKGVENKIEVAEEVTVLPCGKKIAQDNSAKRPLCMKHGATVAKQPATPPEDTELSEAMQKMVHATNEMVMVTRQLVITTQQMLTASKKVAVEVIETGKEAMETSKPEVEKWVNEKEIIATVKEVASATKDALEATSAALSNSLERDKTSPIPEAAPQQ